MQTEKEYIAGREINALRCESVGEYSLPDYNGDVKKVLSVKTKVFPTGKFVGDDLLEFSGSVGYYVVYIDAENNLTHTEFSTDYEAAVKINSQTYVDSDIKTSVASCNTRLIGPRKFSVKCALDNDVRISESRTYSISGDAFAEFEPEVLSSTARVFTAAFAHTEHREFNEELTTVEGAIADEIEVLMCDAYPDVATVEKGDDRALIKGNINASLVYKNGDGAVRAVDKLIPFSEELALEGAGAFDSIEASVDLTSLKASVTPMEDGVAISVSLSCLPKIYAKKNSDIDLITDAYLKERGSDNEYSDFAYTEYICTEQKEERFDGEYSLSECDVEKIDSVIWSDAAAKIEKCEMTDSGAEISGEIRFSAIACQVLEDESTVYMPMKFSLPFTQNVNTNCQIHDNMRADSYVDVRDVRIEPSDNKVSVSCNVLSSVTVCSDKRQRCLGASYLTDEEYSSDRSVVTVYYPDSSESLFEIAKRFHTSPRDIAENNRLSEAVFASQSASVGNLGVKKILIK